jgi:hypothetical protein
MRDTWLPPATETARFRICSGQGRGARTWAVMLRDPSAPWWRYSTADGRVRLYASPAAAYRAATRLESDTPDNARFTSALSGGRLRATIEIRVRED